MSALVDVDGNRSFSNLPKNSFNGSFFFFCYIHFYIYYKLGYNVHRCV